MDWRDGVRVMRAAALAEARRAPAAGGRATVFDFAGSSGQQTWIGTVTLPAGANTGPHHHGRHEVAVYVVSGRSQIRWGEQLEFAAEIGPGDGVYFAPFVPHQELNLDSKVAVEFLVVRSDGARIAEKLDLVPAQMPETVV